MSDNRDALCVPAVEKKTTSHDDQYGAQQGDARAFTMVYISICVDTCCASPWFVSYSN